MASGAVIAFNAAETVERFLSDAMQTVLELPPSLTAEQRKQMKKVVEQHPTLRCESYGFGADRQMHLFKVVSEKSPGDSSTASTAAFNSSTNSTNNSPRDVQPTMNGLQVRNTFIHFEETSKAKDERAVQSMPDGVFRQHLLAEAAEKAAAAAVEKTPAETLLLPTVVEAAEVQDIIASGMQVCVHGLVKAPAFNGRQGMVQSLDAESGRYNVLLNMQHGATQLAKIKAENLRRLMADASERPRPRGLDLDFAEAPAEGYAVFPCTPLWEERAPMPAPLRLTALV